MLEDTPVSLLDATATSTTEIEAVGATRLVQVDAHYFVQPVAGGAGPQLNAFGAPVVAGQFGAFVPIAAEATAGGYVVAWKDAGADQYTVLNADGAGTFQSHAFFVVSGGSFALQSAETTFQQDLNHDGTVGLVTTTVETAGGTTLARVADRFFLYAAGTTSGPSLVYSGAAVTAGAFGGWTPIGVEATGTGYTVAWKNAGADQYSLWTLDGSGAYVANAAGVVAASSLALQSREAGFGQDLNGDGTIGIVPTGTVESAGGTTLARVGDAYVLLAHGTTTGPSFTYNGAPVTVGMFGGWAPIGVEAAGAGYTVAWKNGAADQYTLWTLDGGGAYVANAVGVVSGSSGSIQGLETTFAQDLDGNGTVGVVATDIETAGVTTLARVGDAYFLYAHGTTTGPQLAYNGAAVTAGMFGGWTPIGVEASGTGYTVAWKNAGADQYTLWTLDGGGAYVANALGVVSGSSAALQAAETAFAQDLDGNGTVGIVATDIETVGATTLAQVGDAYLLYAHGTTTGPRLSLGGAAVTAGQFGGWVAIGVEAVGSGYQVAWKLSGVDLYTAWSLDGAGNYLANVIGLLAGASAGVKALEAVVGQDLNGDGTIG
ncbi:MAG: hypothetical protein LCH95_17410 [Proteobacteria bacterium]|nr:hypothetical protein [Pseudomonadota bacterium]